MGSRSGKGLARYSSKVRVVGGLLTPTGTDMLASRYASRGDAPVFQYNATLFSKTKDVHHPKHAVAVKKKCMQKGIPSILLLKDGPKPFTGDPVAEQVKFFFKYLGVVNPDAKKTDDKVKK